MKRKKWSPQEDVTDSVIRSREKRKWQIALRRYVLERNPSSAYAPYFGLDIDRFRNWIELQFPEGADWDDFSEKWQFDFVLPLTYFDFGNDDDLKLCWNFINIRIQELDADKKPINQADVLGARKYFSELFAATAYEPANKMVSKIISLEVVQAGGSQNLEGFINLNKVYLQISAEFGSYEFEKLNAGIELKEIMKERAFLNKFR